MYTAPLDDIRFCLKSVADFDRVASDGLLGDVDPEIVDAILTEAGKFATERLAPINALGDRTGAKLDNGVVTLPEPWDAVYSEWAEAGWSSVAAAEEHGGQGLPTMVAVALSELWNSACLAWALNPLLTAGAIEALEAHGTDTLKDTYLTRLISGEWTGTMNLTEPQAGSDLNALRSRAEPQGDGTYRIFGQKIYITYGEHELTDNIVHLVLARLPDAPAGTRGISLFLVPKFLPDEAGAFTIRNDVFCNGIEHKLGIHASPTCTMIYGDGKFGETPGAIGWLIGEENRGLNCMFTMMNNARLNVGIQGVAIAERATQQALNFALERKQGTGLSGERGTMDPIIVHPDVKRMLHSMQAMTAASRALCYMTARELDIAKSAPDAETRDLAAQKASFLTPVAKAYATDIGTEVASLGIQVHGGMGFVEETGAAQHFRDSRILQIYEGTNGIQAIDLVARKLGLGNGEIVEAYLSEFEEIAKDVAATNSTVYGHIGARLISGVEHLRQATEVMVDAAKTNPHHLLANATPYLRLFALVGGGAWLAKSAMNAVRSDTPDAPKRVQTARFFCEHHTGSSGSLADEIADGADSVLTDTFHAA
ncbi:MAG: acyl-CoA dehydrogenase [Pseudomonadota bacterium]